MIEVLKKPVCLVTGGSSGIGLATAKLFFSRGYRVAICGRSEDRLRAACQTIIGDGPLDPKLVFPAAVDLSRPANARRFAEDSLDHFGRIDVLVNNAAIAPLTPFGALTESDFEELVDLNIRSWFYLTQIVWNTMVKQSKGTIVNISSMAAIDPFPGFSLYGASKAWVDLLTHSLGQEGENLGVRVCSVRPGAVETPMLRGLFPDFPDDQCMQPQDVAQVVLNCVQDPQAFPSGQAFPVVPT